MTVICLLLAAIVAALGGVVIFELQEVRKELPRRHHVERHAPVVRPVI